MKRNLLLVGAALFGALALTACSNEDFASVEPAAAEGEYTLTATVGGDTRTYVEEDNSTYNVYWNSDDAIIVYNSSTSKTLTYKSGAGSTSATFSARFAGSAPAFTNAVYPVSSFTMDGNTPKTFTFPADNNGTAAYTHPGTGQMMQTNAPMWGEVSDKTVTFHHLAGMVRITLKDVPAGESGTLTLTSQQAITGDATFSDGTLTAPTATDNNKTVTVSFDNSTGTEAAEFIIDIPLPAGTYNDGIGTVTLSKTDGTPAELYEIANTEVVAGSLIVMPAIQDIDFTAEAPSFSQVAKDVAAANTALEEGAKSVTIETVQNSETTVKIPSTSTADDPVTINYDGEETIAIEPATDETGTGLAVIVNAPNATVTVNSSITRLEGSFSDNTLKIGANVVIDELIIHQGGIDIDRSAWVKKITLEGDATIKRALNVAAEKPMEINVGTHTLKLAYDNSDTYTYDGKTYVYAYDEVLSELKLTGDASQKGTIESSCYGIALSEAGATIKMENINYTETSAGSNGIFMNEHATTASIIINNSSITGKYYCLGTNALEKVGENCQFTLTNSTFTAEETALLFNIPATLTATGCTFTGGWQGAIVRSGEATFTDCTLTLNVSSSYDNGKASNVPVGNTEWKVGNQVPSAALTLGNQNSQYYNYPKTVNLTNCTFSVQKDGADSTDYPSVYIDSNGNQPVTLTCDNTSGASISAAGKGCINNSSTDLTNVTITGVTASQFTND